MQLSRCGALVAGLDALVIALTTGSARQAPRHLGHAQQWLAVVGPDRAALEVAVAVLWGIAVWLAVALLSAVISAAPGTLGALGTTLAHYTMPRAMRLALLGSVGVSVVLTPGLAAASPLGASGARSAPAPSALGSSGTASRSVSDHAAARTLRSPDLDVGWPDSSPRAHPRAPRIDWPRSPAGSSTDSRPSAQPTANRSATRNGSTYPSTSSHHPGNVVTVAPGDSLWLIAAHRLAPDASPARIASAWPRWYAANRRVIGASPDRIRPGQQLTEPTEKGTST